MTEIVNRVEKSGLITVDLEKVIGKLEVHEYDLSIHLFQGLVLKEKDFRKQIKETNWADYEGQNVHIVCSVDAIVPIWAYMLVLSKLEAVTSLTVVGSEDDLKKKLISNKLSELDLSQFENAKIVVKGCGDEEIPLFAYGEVMRLLMPVASSIMFGEPCSTVPLFKKRIPK